MADDVQAVLVDGLLAHAVPDGAPFTSREQVLLAYADMVTLAPATITRADIERLRAEGLDDLAIHDACAIAAYFAFVNRIADGLGVELEAPEA